MNTKEKEVDGLSKREWFVGMAMNGLLCSIEKTEYYKNCDYVPQLAIKIADKVIEEMDKTNTQK